MPLHSKAHQRARAKLKARNSGFRTMHDVLVNNKIKAKKRKKR